ncbi:MAG: EAL domain-containing response regulator [Natronospirillum sp.]
MHHPRLLVLDDEPAVSRTIALFAQGAGFATRSTSTPEDFFREFDEWQPTHLAIDLIMPAMDGVEVMRRLAESQVRAGIIITSGVGSRVLDAARRSAAERGLNIIGVLAKPFSPANLRTLLARPQSDQTVSWDADTEAFPNDFEVTETELRTALAREELYLDFQPKIDCRTNTVAGFEALVRWASPEAGMLMPDQFVPLAETTGLIDKLTDQVLSQGLRWLARHFPESSISLSLNLSVRSLVNATLGDHLYALCQRYAINPKRLILELTESSAMEDPTNSLDLLTRLRMKGFQLSIDDFGTGYSSMVQLVRLPFSELKVDKSFVLEATRSEESRSVIKSIIGLGHSLGLRVTAEGIEDVAAHEFVCGSGCDLAQGYYHAYPLAHDQVVDWCKTRVNHAR